METILLTTQCRKASSPTDNVLPGRAFRLSPQQLELGSQKIALVDLMTVNVTNFSPLRGGRWRLPHRAFPSLSESGYTNVTRARGPPPSPQYGACTIGFLTGSPGGFWTEARGLAPVFRHGVRGPRTGFPRGFLGRFRQVSRQLTGRLQDHLAQGPMANDACEHSSLPSPMHYDQEAPPSCFLRPAVIPNLSYALRLTRGS